MVWHLVKKKKQNKTKKNILWSCTYDGMFSSENKPCEAATSSGCSDFYSKGGSQAQWNEAHYFHPVDCCCVQREGKVNGEFTY